MKQRGMNRRLGKKMRGGAAAADAAAGPAAAEPAAAAPPSKKAKLKKTAESVHEFLGFKDAKLGFQWGKLQSYISYLIIPSFILLFMYRYTFSEKPDEDTGENNFIFGWNISKNGFKNVVIWGQGILTILCFVLYSADSELMNFLELGIAFMLFLILWGLVFLYGLDPYVSEECWEAKEHQREKDLMNLGLEVGGVIGIGVVIWGLKKLWDRRG